MHLFCIKRESGAVFRAEENDRVRNGRCANMLGAKFCAYVCTVQESWKRNTWNCDLSAHMVGNAVSILVLRRGQDHRKWYFLKEQPTTAQDCRGVIPEIPSHGWEYPNYWVTTKSSGLPEILGNTRYFGLPSTRWFSKLNRVRYKKIPSSGLGTCWALVARNPLVKSARGFRRS